MPLVPNQVAPGRRALDGKTVVKLFTPEGVRELLIPSKEPNYYPVVISNTKLKSLKELSEKKEVPDLTKEKERLAKESFDRKQKFREIDKKVKAKCQKLSDLEQEAKDQANYLLKRAWEAKVEQEDEIKLANSLILRTKCQTIRDAQLSEKIMIKKQLEYEDKRAAKVMELARMKEIIKEGRDIEKLQSKKTKYIKELTTQVKEIQKNRIVEAEKKLEEHALINKAIYNSMIEDAKKLRKEAEEKARIRDELIMANEQIHKAHELEKEEERLLDLKVQAWMKQRAEREEAFEKEQREIKKAKEKEIARLRGLQERANDLRSFQDEMAAVRLQEEQEREWRRKEKEAVEKKKATEEMLVATRYKQIEDIRKMQALEIAREKREFERIAIIQKEKEEMERLKDVKRKLEAENYRMALLQQMNEKEAEIIHQRAEELAEGVTVRAEESRRNQDIRKVLETKLEQLRSTKVPEIYIADIKRQLRINEME